MSKIEMPECRRNVIPASLVLPLVRNISPASAFRHRRQSGTAGHGQVRQCPAMASMYTEIVNNKTAFELS
jgi:hypothetical protein